MNHIPFTSGGSHSRRSRKGQIIVIMLGVMMIALIVGLSVSSRVITSIRQSSYSGQSAEALSLAEAGAEDGLKRLKDDPTLIHHLPYYHGDAALGGGIFNYTISLLGASAVFTEFSPISRDEVIQIELNGYPAAVSVNISWVDSSHPDEQSERMALVATLVYDDGGVYKARRYAWDPNGARAAANNFATPGSIGYTPLAGGPTYRYQASVATPAGVTLKFLRVRALYGVSTTPNSIAVSGTGGSNIPSQGIVISSTGYVGKTRRSIEVFKSEPMLPEIFDFVLWSNANLTR